MEDNEVGKSAEQKSHKESNIAKQNQVINDNIDINKKSHIEVQGKDETEIVLKTLEPIEVVKEIEISDIDMNEDIPEKPITEQVIPSHANVNNTPVIDVDELADKIEIINPLPLEKSNDQVHKSCDLKSADKSVSLDTTIPMNLDVSDITDNDIPQKCDTEPIDVVPTDNTVDCFQAEELPHPYGVTGKIDIIVKKSTKGNDDCGISVSESIMDVENQIEEPMALDIVEDVPNCLKMENNSNLNEVHEISDSESIVGEENLKTLPVLVEIEDGSSTRVESLSCLNKTKNVQINDVVENKVEDPAHKLIKSSQVETPSDIEQEDVENIVGDVNMDSNLNLNEVQDVDESEPVCGAIKPVDGIEKFNNLPVLVPMKHQVTERVESLATLNESANIEINDVHEISDSESIEGKGEEPADNFNKSTQVETHSDMEPEAIENVVTDLNMDSSLNLNEVQDVDESEPVCGAIKPVDGIEKFNNLPVLVPMKHQVTERVESLATLNESANIEINDVHEISDSESIEGRGEEPADNLIISTQVETPIDQEVEANVNMEESSNLKDTEDNFPVVSIPTNSEAAKRVESPFCWDIADILEIDDIHEISDSESTHNVVELLRVERPLIMDTESNSSLNEVQEISDSESVDGTAKASQKGNQGVTEPKNNSSTKGNVDPNEIHEISDSESIEGDKNVMDLPPEITQNIKVVDSEEKNTPRKISENKLRNTIIEIEDNSTSVNNNNKTDEIVLDEHILEISDDDDDIEEVNKTHFNSSIINQMRDFRHINNSTQYQKARIYKNKFTTPNVQWNYRIQQSDSPSSSKKSNVRGLLGVEYVIKIIKFRSDRNPKYYCCLCEKYNDALGMEAHLESIVHRLKYCKKYFPTAVRECRQCVYNMESEIASKIMVLLLRKLSISIELYYGRELPYTCYTEVYDLKSNEVIDKIFSSQHYSEEHGPTFTHIVDTVDIKDLIKEAENDFTTCPAKWPIFESTLNNESPYNDSNVNQFENINRPYGQHNPKRQRTFWPRKRRQNAGRESSFTTYRDTFTVSPDNVRESSFMSKNCQPIGDTTRSILKRPRIQMYENRYIIKRPNLTQPTTEAMKIAQNAYDHDQPSSSQTAPIANPLDENVIKAKYNQLLKEKAQEIDALFESYVKKPETYPSFTQEWQTFFKCHKIKIQNKGLDHHSYNYEDDWKEHFQKRLMEFRKDAWDEAKLSIFKKINTELEMSKTNDGSQLKQISSLQLQLPNDQTDNSLLHVMRNLSKLKDLLGCFRDSVLTLMCDTLQMEEEQHNNANQVLSAENYTTLKLLMHKFTDLLMSNLVEENRKNDLQLAVNSISHLLSSLK